MPKQPIAPKHPTIKPSALGKRVPTQPLAREIRAYSKSALDFGPLTAVATGKKEPSKSSL
ncbi:hypothetical protein UFOVP235_53 [uncultured Caudovirales phage]|uniref:Uncharacterized protein n=1 Tax=uncultured Caudovirales phage TaxID=2100421 RepID=A0A6J7WU76_9CAUD|nr:hypothetical protein UFOVP235_53 [uncultured Caudovirales phage]